MCHAGSLRVAQRSEASDQCDSTSGHTDHSSESGHDRWTVVKRRLDYSEAVRAQLTWLKSADDYFGEC